MEWGPRLKHLRRLQKQGVKVQALDTQPLVTVNMSWAWTAYGVLDKSRQWGQGFPQPIQHSEIMSYARSRNMTLGAIDDLVEIVQYLDGLYLERLARRAAIPAKKVGK